jgi:hypothetical protein
MAFSFYQNLQNLQNHFLTWKVANRLLSGGKAVAEPHPNKVLPVLLVL